MGRRVVRRNRLARRPFLFFLFLLPPLLFPPPAALAFFSVQRNARAYARLPRRKKEEYKRRGGTGVDFKMSDNLYRGPFYQLYPPFLPTYSPLPVKTFDVVILAELIIPLPRSGSLFIFPSSPSPVLVTRKLIRRDSGGFWL